MREAVSGEAFVSPESDVAEEEVKGRLWCALM